MQRLFACAVLVLMVLPAWSQDKSDAVKKELEKLQGEWKLVGGDGPGSKLTEEDFVGRMIVIKGDAYEYVSPSETEKEKGKFTLNPAATPAQVDMEIIEGHSKGQKQLGIYELKDNRLRFCVAQPNDPKRPPKFAVTPEDRFMLYAFERVKK